MRIVNICAAFLLAFSAKPAVSSVVYDFVYSSPPSLETSSSTGTDVDRVVFGHEFRFSFAASLLDLTGSGPYRWSLGADMFANVIWYSGEMTCPEAGYGYYDGCVESIPGLTVSGLLNNRYIGFDVELETSPLMVTNWYIESYSEYDPYYFSHPGGREARFVRDDYDECYGPNYNWICEGDYQLRFLSSDPGTWTVTQTVAPIPLPAGLPLLATALGVLALIRRRKAAG